MTTINNNHTKVGDGLFEILKNLVYQEPTSKELVVELVIAIRKRVNDSLMSQKQSNEFILTDENLAEKLIQQEDAFGNFGLGFFGPPGFKTQDTTAILPPGYGHKFLYCLFAWSATDYDYKVELQKIKDSVDSLNLRKAHKRIKQFDELIKLKVELEASWHNFNEVNNVQLTSTLLEQSADVLINCERVLIRMGFDIKVEHSAHLEQDYLKNYLLPGNFKKRRLMQSSFMIREIYHAANRAEHSEVSDANQWVAELFSGLGISFNTSSKINRFGGKTEASKNFALNPHPELLQLKILNKILES